MQTLQLYGPRQQHQHVCTAELAVAQSQLTTLIIAKIMGAFSIVTSRRFQHKDVSEVCRNKCHRWHLHHLYGFFRRFRLRLIPFPNQPGVEPTVRVSLTAGLPADVSVPDEPPLPVLTPLCSTRSIPTI